MQSPVHMLLVDLNLHWAENHSSQSSENLGCQRHLHRNFDYTECGTFHKSTTYIPLTCTNIIRTAITEQVLVSLFKFMTLKILKIYAAGQNCVHPCAYHLFCVKIVMKCYYNFTCKKRISSDHMLSAFWYEFQCNQCNIFLQALKVLLALSLGCNS